MSFANYPPSRNDPADAQRAQDGLPTTHRVYQWSWENPHDFTAVQRTAIAMGINSMQALGETHVWDDRLAGVQKVVIARWPDDNSIRPGPAQTHNAGRTSWAGDGKIVVWFDTSGLHGTDAAFRAGQHETGHVVMGPGLPNDGHVSSAAIAVMNDTIPEAQFDPLPIGDQPTEDTMSGGGRLLGPTAADFSLHDAAMPTYEARVREARGLIST